MSALSRIPVVHCDVIRTAEVTFSPSAPTRMRCFRFGTASRLMVRPWRSRPDCALVAIYTITASLRCRSTAQFTPWSTTISVRGAISSHDRFTSGDAQPHWWSGARLRRRSSLASRRVASRLDEQWLVRQGPYSRSSRRTSNVEPLRDQELGAFGSVVTGRGCTLLPSTRLTGGLRIT
jgi:hypothetical protein